MPRKPVGYQPAPIGPFMMRLLVVMATCAACVLIVLSDGRLINSSSNGNSPITPARFVDTACHKLGSAERTDAN